MRMGETAPLRTSLGTVLSTTVALLIVTAMAGCASGTTAAGPEANAVVHCVSTTAGCQGVQILPETCGSQLFPQRKRPYAAGGTLSAGLLSSFAIFRRREAADDRPPAQELAGGQVGTQLFKDYDLASYYPAYVRRVTSRGGRYYVVPGFAQPEKVPSAACLRRGVDRTRLLEQQRRRVLELVYCVIEVPEKNGSSLECEPFATVAQSVSVFNASDFLRTPVVALVPDGVAELRVTYRELPAVRVPVTENAVVFEPPVAPRVIHGELIRLRMKLFQGRASAAITVEWNRALRKTYPSRIEWLNSDGSVIRTISPPTPSSVASTSIGDVRAPIGG